MGNRIDRAGRQTVMRKTLSGLMAAAMTVSACSGPGLEDTLKLNDDPDSALLIVKDEGGFVPIEFIVGQGPRLVLLRDGSLIVSGPQIEIFPQPLLPNYQTVQLDDETISLHPGMCILIRPGTRHRAIGKMKVLIV